MNNKTILTIRHNSSVIELTEELNGLQTLNEAATVNTAAVVAGPDGKTYDMQQIQEYVEASVDYINKYCPYLTPFSTKLIRCFTFAVDTMATDGIYIFINPGFVLNLVEKCNGLDGVLFVLIHEIYHNLFSHKEREAAQPDIFNPYDANVANCAEDYEINWIISETTEDPREMSEYDPNDPDDVPPYELDANGKSTGVKRLVFKGIVDKIGGLLDPKFAGWNAEKIYQYLITHKNELPPMGEPPKKIKIDSTDSQQDSSGNAGGSIDSPDEIEYDINQDEREGFEAGWAQAIADMRAQGLLESFTVSNKLFQSIFEAMSTGNAAYDKGYDNGYAACIKQVQDMIKNGSMGNSGNSPKITGIPPKCEMPKVKQPEETQDNQQNGSNQTNNSSDSQEGQGQSDSQQNGSQSSSTSDKQNPQQSNDSSISMQDIIDKIDKLAKEHPVQSDSSKSSNSDNSAENSDNSVAKPDGEYIGGDSFGVGQHTISKAEGAEIAKNAGIDMDDILKSGNNAESVFDDEGKVMAALKDIDKRLTMHQERASRDSNKKDSSQPGRGIIDGIIGILSDIRTTTIDWREELEDYFNGRIHMQNIGYNNNYIWDERYVDIYDYDEPDALEKIVIFLDTSGSMMGSEDDVAKCIHNIKQIIRDTDAVSADLYLFADGIYYGAPLDVNNISDNYENYNINLPIKSGGTTYKQIFSTIYTQYLDKRIIPDCIIVMTDSDLYYSIKDLPKDFACADDTVFMVVSDAKPKKLPFGTAIYVKPGDFNKVARKTKLNESMKPLQKFIPKRRIYPVDEAIKMPVKRVHAQDSDILGQADSVDNTVSQEPPVLSQERCHDIVKNAMRSDPESWKNLLDTAVTTIKNFPRLDVLFNKVGRNINVRHETDYEKTYQIVNDYLEIIIYNTGNIKIYGNVTLFGDDKINLWEQLFTEIDDACDDMIDFTSITGNMSIIGCKISALPKHMPNAIHGNLSLLRLPELATLDNLPKYNYINIDNCPKLSEDELERAGVVEESVKPKGRGMSAIIESRLALAKQFKSLNESTTGNAVNEEFRSTTFAKLFNQKEGSQRNGNRALTYVSEKNREILNKVEGTSDFPVMWSEITDDMITITHPNNDAKSKATYERRDQNKTDDWGIRIACDDEGKIIFIITGNNLAKENKNRRSHDEPYQLYNWIDNGWLYVDKDIIDVINLRIDNLKYAKLGFAVYLNAYFKLGIISTLVEDLQSNNSKLLDMTYVMRKVNAQDPDNLPGKYKKVRDIWTTVKNSDLYVDLTNSNVQSMIYNYYTNVLNADPGYINELDQVLKNAAPAIEDFKSFGLDYAKQNLMRLTGKVRVIPDNTPMGYHLFNMTFPDLELILDHVETIYDIDSEHSSYASRMPGDDRAELGKINPYDKDILKYGEFDIKKNRETDAAERSKFGILNNSRKRKLIQNVRDNAITGTNYSLKQLNDPALMKKDAEGKLFTPNTDEQTKESLSGISDMIRGLNTKFDKTTKVFERLYPDVAKYDKYNKVQKHYDRIKRAIDMYADAGNNLIKQSKIADMMLVKLGYEYDGKRTRSIGYQDTVSGQIAAAIERVKHNTSREVNDIYDITDPGYGILPAIENICYIDIKAFMAKDWNDIKKKLKFYHSTTDNDDKKTRHTMKVQQEAIDSLRSNSINKLARPISLLVSGYAFLINDMTALRADLRALGKSE